MSDSATTEEEAALPDIELLSSGDVTINDVAPVTGHAASVMPDSGSPESVQVEGMADLVEASEEEEPEQTAPEPELTDEELERRNDVTIDDTVVEVSDTEKIHPAAKSDSRTGHYVFPGIGGIPYRNRHGKAPNFKGDPITGGHLVQTYSAYVQIFDLSDNEDIIKYQEIMNKCTRGCAQISDEEKVYDNDIKSWRVFLRWTETFLEDASRGRTT